jgi:lipopolysaccharide transport system ATP-binding protein
MSIVIAAERLSKRYDLGLRDAPLENLREVLLRGLRRPRQMLRRWTGADDPSGPDWIWALRDVTFEVEQGEVLAVIGPNGAGKSTLLKILSRVTEPTEGYAEVHGRVGSLLEVGTGFHPELTGRENIFLNGAILGMRRVEISRKFDEIVAFAEVAPFIDTPVKFYSSGMYLRLAFAVAAHLEPEILVVDEVLAVGDAAFQSKCLTKMSDVARAGRTVLFVSHNLAAVQKLCSRAILIRDGNAAADGLVHEVVASYLAGLERLFVEDLRERRDRGGQGQVRLIGIETYIEDQPSAGRLVTGKAARIVFRMNAVGRGMTCSFTIYDQLGLPVTYFDSVERSPKDAANPSGEPIFSCEIHEVILVPGRYRINAAIYGDRQLQDHVEAAAFIQVEQGLLDGRLVLRNASYGSFVMPHRWISPRPA